MPREHQQRDFVLWGSKGHALVLDAAIRLWGGRVVALVDNDPRAVSCLPGVPLFFAEDGLDRALKGHDRKKLFGLVAIGGANGAARRAIHALFTIRGIEMATLVHPGASICDTARIGAGTQILAKAVVAALAHVSDDCIVNHGAIVDHETTLAAGCHIAPGAILCGCVNAGEDVFVGAGATVLPRLTLGRGSVIGAGAVVTRSVQDFCKVLGNPARNVGI